MQPQEIKTREQWEQYELECWFTAYANGLRAEQLEWHFRDKIRALHDRKS